MCGGKEQRVALGLATRQITPEVENSWCDCGRGLVLFMVTVLFLHEKLRAFIEESSEFYPLVVVLLDKEKASLPVFFVNWLCVSRLGGTYPGPFGHALFYCHFWKRKYTVLKWRFWRRFSEDFRVFNLAAKPLLGHLPRLVEARRQA